MKRSDVVRERVYGELINSFSEVREVVVEKLNLSDEYLLIAYKESVKLKLDEEFIYLLEKEIKRRDFISIKKCMNH